MACRAPCAAYQGDGGALGWDARRCPIGLSRLYLLGGRRSSKSRSRGGERAQGGARRRGKARKTIRQPVAILERCHPCQNWRRTVGASPGNRRAASAGLGGVGHPRQAGDAHSIRRAWASRRTVELLGIAWMMRASSSLSIRPSLDCCPPRWRRPTRSFESRDSSRDSRRTSPRLQRGPVAAAQREPHRCSSAHQPIVR